MSAREPQWRPIPGASMYEASDQGQVRSWRRPGRPSSSKERSAVPRSLLPAVGKNGYQRLLITGDDGRPRTRYVHALVLLAFRGPRPPGLDSRHANGIKTDNRLSNLNYSTRSQNIRDQLRHGVHPQASKTHCSAGHPFNDQNTVRRERNGGERRDCIACSQNRARIRYAAVRAIGEIAKLIAAETRPTIEVERIRRLIPPELLSDEGKIRQRVPTQRRRETAVPHVLQP